MLIIASCYVSICIQIVNLILTKCKKTFDIRICCSYRISCHWIFTIFWENASIHDICFCANVCCTQLQICAIKLCTIRIQNTILISKHINTITNNIKSRCIQCNLCCSWQITLISIERLKSLIKIGIFCVNTSRRNRWNWSIAFIWKSWILCFCRFMIRICIILLRLGFCFCLHLRFYFRFCFSFCLCFRLCLCFSFIFSILCACFCLLKTCFLLFSGSCLCLCFRFFLCLRLCFCLWFCLRLIFCLRFFLCFCLWFWFSFCFIHRFFLCATLFF